MLSERSLLLHLIRFLSAVFVCLSHSRDFYLLPMGANPSILELIIRLSLSLGSASVLVFFFLSGYLVGGNEIVKVSQNALQSSKYFLDRLTRLWLVLIPALSLTFLLNLFSCQSNRVSLYCSASRVLGSHAQTPPISSQDFSSFLGSVFFLQPFKGGVFGGNGPLWSLSYEFWYYMVFYLFILIISSIRAKKIEKWLLVFVPISIVGLSILSYDWAILGIVWLAGAISKKVTNRCDQKYFRQRFNFTWDMKIFFVFTFVVMPAILSIRLLPRFALSFPILFALMVIAISLTSDRKMISKDNLLAKGITLGSEISFSLYLIHFPLLALISTYVTPVVRWNFGFSSVVFVICMAPVSLILAFFFAQLTELRLAAVRLKLRAFYKI